MTEPAKTDPFAPAIVAAAGSGLKGDATAEEQLAVAAEEARAQSPQRKSEGMAFEEWNEILVKLAVELHPSNESYIRSDPRAWREGYFDEDYSAGEALDEDRSYWD
jgi:hypothetical protein